MAVINPVSIQLPAIGGNIGLAEHVWTPLGVGDKGDKVGCARYADRSISASGTFGGATVTMQGTNTLDPAEADWVPIRDGIGDPITFTSNGLLEVLPLSLWIRPVITGGSGTSVTVLLLGKL